MEETLILTKVLLRGSPRDHADDLLDLLQRRSADIIRYYQMRSRKQKAIGRGISVFLGIMVFTISRTKFIETSVSLSDFSSMLTILGAFGVSLTPAKLLGRKSKRKHDRFVIFYRDVTALRDEVGLVNADDAFLRRAFELKGRFLILDELIGPPRQF